MRLTQKLPAVVLAVLAGATWAVPAAVSRAVENPTTTVNTRETEALEATAGANLEYQAPEGWSTSPSTSRASVVYTKPEDDQTLKMSVVDGSQDFDVTADRVLRQQALDGTSAAFDGGEIKTSNGFTGKSCVAIKTEEKATGPCAVVHKEDLVVLVIATSTGKGEAPDLQNLLNSFTTVKGAAE